MKTLIIILMMGLPLLQYSALAIPKDLPATYLGEYHGEPNNVKAEIKKRNREVLPYMENIVTLGGKHLVKWQYKDFSSNRTSFYTGTYTIMQEQPQYYAALCSVSMKQGNSTVSTKFYLHIMKDGGIIKYLDYSQTRPFTLKKK